MFPSHNKSFAVTNPASLEHLTQVAEAQPSDVYSAITAAQHAFATQTWARMEPREKSLILTRAATLLEAKVKEFAELESLQTGRAIREMYAQLGRLPEWLEYFAALIRTSEGSVPPFKGQYVNYVKRVPLGVVAQITPWNHPMLISIKKIAPALAAGNSIVVKPSELAPVTLLEFAKLLKEAGLPDGVFNIVPGFGASTGATLVQDPRVRLVDITGGTPTGKIVASEAGKNLASCVAELGGKAPMIVFSDADIQAAINGCTFGSFIATGQTCIMGARLLVQEDIYQDFVAKFVQKVKRIQLGSPQDPDCQMGPVISAKQRERVEDFVRIAQEEGAEILTGGTRPDDSLGLKGHYFLPTVIGNVHPKMRIVQEEVFGPVVVVYRFKDEAEAIKLANDSPFGLAASIWTSNVKRAHRVADRLDVGIIWINDHHRNDPSSPWGGMKQSGMGRENGLEALRQYSQAKSVIVGFDDAPFDWFSDPKARYG